MEGPIVRRRAKVPIRPLCVAVLLVNLEKVGLQLDADLIVGRVGIVFKPLDRG